MKKLLYIIFLVLFGFNCYADNLSVSHRAVWKYDSSGDLEPVGSDAKIPAEHVGVNKLGTPTYEDLQAIINTYMSSGKFTGGGFTDNEDGSITVAAGTGLIKSTDSDTGTLYSFDWAEDTNVTLTDNSVNFIYVDYNSGTPQIGVATSSPTDHNTKVLLGLVYRSGTTLHMTNAGQLIANYPAKTCWKDMEVNGKFQWVSGVKPSETGTRYLKLSEGTIYAGLTKKSISAYDSTSTALTAYYSDGGTGWNAASVQQIDNQYYDDDSGTLASLTADYKTCRYIYIDPDGHVYMVYGTSQYSKLADAIEEEAPSYLPDLLGNIGMLVGKVIVKEGETNFKRVYSYLGQKAPAGTVADHQDLGGIPGSSEGYHISEQEYKDFQEQFNPYSIGKAGEAGFGVGAYQGTLPSGFTALTGSSNLLSPNYGNYQYADDSIMVWIPKFYYKIHTGADLSVNTIEIRGANYFTDTAAANTAGYALHRAFIDGGSEQDGFFIDKYKCSKNALGTGYVASSIKNGNPISIHANHNPIADLTACSDNDYYETINAVHARDGSNGAVNTDSIFFVTSQFQRAALAMLSMAHAQATAGATPDNAWYSSSYPYPKGCNNDALSDTDDSEISYTTDGYSNCGQTGSGTPFSKTTHNGQTCGVADLNGLIYEVSLGVTCITTNDTIEDISRANPAVVTETGHTKSTGDVIMITGIDVGDWAGLDDKLYTVTKINANTYSLNGVNTTGFSTAYAVGTNAGTTTSGTFYTAKQATSMKDFTSGHSSATDHWGATGCAAMMETFTPAFKTDYPNNGFSQRFGSGSNQMLSAATFGDGWLLTGLGFPVNADGISASGTTQFGQDHYYQYIGNELYLRSCAFWDSSSYAGIWAVGWNSIRTSSGHNIGFRAACYPE